MERQDFYVISFENTHSAMEAQKQLKGRYAITVIPTLREISQSCGISVMLPEMSREEAVAAALSLELEPGMYQLYYAQGDRSCRAVSPVETARRP